MKSDFPRLHGSRPESVLRILESRLQDRALGRKHFTDNAKLGLIVEGGGVRGAVSAGGLSVLSDAQANDVFDAVYGTSAGALNAAYFVAGQVDDGVRIYFEDIQKTEFLRLRRWPDVMSIPYLFDDCVAQGSKRLRLDKVSVAPTNFFVSVTRVRDGSPHTFNVRGMPPQRIFSLLKASSSTPMMSTHHEFFNGEFYNDGDIHSAIPVNRALADGCTHMLAFLTKERGYRRQPSLWMKNLERLRMRPYPEDYRKQFFDGPAHYNRALDALFAENAEAATLPICPEPGEFLIESHERKRERIERVYFEAKARARQLMKTAKASRDLQP